MYRRRRVTPPGTRFHAASPTGGDVWSMFQRGVSSENLAVIFRTGTNTANDWIIGKKSGGEHLVFGYGASHSIRGGYSFSTTTPRTYAS